MKKVLLVVGLFFLTASFAYAGSAPQSGGGGVSGSSNLAPINFIDSERVARWLILHPIDRCNGIFGFWRNNVDLVQGFFKMLYPSGLITRLKIQEEDIVTEKDKPWTGLPRNQEQEGEARNFWLWIACGNQNENVAFGSMQDSLFTENDRIMIDLELDDVRVEVPTDRLSIPEGADPHDLFLFVGRSYSYYNEFCRCFFAWIDPLETPVFTLKDADGNRIATGILDVFGGASTDAVVPVNVKFKGNIREVIFDETITYTNVQIQHFDGEVLRCPSQVDESTVIPLPSGTECEVSAVFPAKVLPVKNLNERSLTISISGRSSVEVSLIEVFRVAQNGEKIRIPTNPVPGRPLDVQVPSGYEDVFITIVGKTREEISLYVDLSLLGGGKG